jgi:hypothetical protein
MVEGIRTLAVGGSVPNRPKKRHCRRRNEPPVGSLPANLAAAAVNKMLFLLAARFVVGLDFPQGLFLLFNWGDHLISRSIPEVHIIPL